MATEYLSRRQAVDAVCLQLEAYAVHRDLGASVADAAAATGISEERGVRFELCLLVLLAALREDGASRVDAITRQTAPDASADPAAMVHTKDGVPFPPGGCRYCGISERGHAQRWTEQARWHCWTAPTDEQRLARMRARRALKTETAPDAPGAATNTHQE